MKVDLKSIINIFTVVDGNLYLLMNNDKLIEFDCYDEIDKSSNEYINKIINNKKTNLKQCYTFSNKDTDKLTITVLYVDFVNCDSVKLLNNYKFVELNKINNNIYISKSIEYLKKELVLIDNIKKIYPDEFSLPEIQKLYEYLFDKKYDRRNFRKKLIKLNIIQDINKISSTKNGRPAKLYKFNEVQKEISMF